MALRRPRVRIPLGPQRRNRRKAVFCIAYAEKNGLEALCLQLTL